MLIKNALDRHAADQEKRFSHDRSQTIGASEIGQCSRRVWYLKNEQDRRLHITRDVDFNDEWGARMRGTIFEDFFWVPAMQKQFGEQLVHAGIEQETLADGFISATPDGILIDLTDVQRGMIATHAKIPVDEIGRAVMVECKTVDPRTNLTEAKEENVYQTQVQMGLARMLTPYRPTHSIISYTDASWWNLVQEYVVPYDQEVFNTAKRRALAIMTAENPGDLKPEGWIAGGRECKYCPFTGPCGVERRNIPFSKEKTQEQLDRIGPQAVAEITDMAREVKIVEAMRDDADVELRAMQDALKTRMRELNVRAIPNVVTWSNVKGRAGYDNKAIREAATAAGIDVEQFATEGEPGERLTIRVSTNASEQETETGKQQ